MQQRQEGRMLYSRRGQSGGGASEEPSPARLLLAICFGEGEEARIFWGLRRKKAKEALADEEITMLIGCFIAQDWGDESVACAGAAFTPGSNRGTYG